MENKEQEHAKAPNTDHPKPSDEVQLTIETVTPDTVRAVPETTVDSKVVEEKTEGANDNQEAPKVAQSVDQDVDPADQQTNEEVENIDDEENVKDEASGDNVESIESVKNDDSSEEADQQGDEAEASEEEGAQQEPAGGSNDETAANSENDKQAGGDERDQIETVAP